MPQVPLYITGELLKQSLQPPGPVVLFASKFNPKAEAVAQELQAMYSAVSHIDDPAPFGSASPALCLTTMSTSQSMHVDQGCKTPKGQLSQGAVAQQSRLPTHFLLCLNFETFVGEGGARLAEEVRTAREAKLPFVLAHENDPDKGGCQFER